MTLGDPGVLIVRRDAEQDFLIRGRALAWTTFVRFASHFQDCHFLLFALILTKLRGLRLVIVTVFGHDSNQLRPTS